MNSGAYLTASGMLVQMRKLDILTNNFANISTPGYKKDSSFLSVFSRALNTDQPDHEMISKVTNQTPFVAGTLTDFSQGIFRETGNSFDLSIEGDGFFVINIPNGTAYTRNGALRVDKEGKLVTGSGYPVIGENGPIHLAEGDVKVGEDGTIKVNDQEMAKLKIVSISNKEILMKYANGLFISPQGENIKEEKSLASIKQGELEGSNVEVMQELGTMIETFRAFETYQKIFQSITSDVDSRLIDHIGNVT
ncbi:MAG: flagellar basal-body rod protein FlgF [Candidatus Schekmanbacteria bacterium RBG_13_48_7]|uniref:Flagellar basal-body rod protein FlgF n=1 Tax=Candidatus Schekmanbacteria bacterium RBG_13_48_7 TaxID=1817878 RepID=A0A1F7RKC3_9BACT|nr:MAG: flagellar basal-body rod protein FlgF [Candidatus Schekmanbacteria bacterium RBG_13_48_7]